MYFYFTYIYMYIVENPYYWRGKRSICHLEVLLKLLSHGLTESTCAGDNPLIISDPYNAEIQSKRLMGKSSKTLIADEFHKDCQQLQK